MDINDINVIIPRGLENLQLPDSDLLNYYIDLDKRIFWIDNEIDNYSLELIKYILRWNEEDKVLPLEQRKPIKLFFFSPGGSLDVNYALIDTITMSKTPVIGVNIGQCASAAAFIYLSCHQRLMMPHAYFLFHQGGGVLQGTFAEIYAQMQDYQDQVEELSTFMAAHTKFSKKDIEEKIVGEWYVRKEDAIKYEVCNKVIENLGELE